MARSAAVAWGSTADIEINGDSTTAPTRLRLSAWPRAPSQATIARTASRLRAVPAMSAIAIWAAANDDDTTQHGPRHGAWTRAPCHTRTTTPPGRPTNPHWKAAPVGRVKEHDIENGNAGAAVFVVVVPCAVSGDSVRGVHERVMECSSVATVSALISAVTMVPSRFPVLHPPATTPVLGISLALPPHTPDSIPIATGASVNLVGSRNHDALVAGCRSTVDVSA